MNDNLKSGKSKSIRFSIRSKLMFSILSVVLLFGSIHIYVVFQIVNRALEEEFYKKGVMLTRHLAYQLEEAVLYEDKTAIQQMLWQWKSDASEHGYALVILSSKEVAASTFVDGIPVGLVEANLPSGAQHQFKNVTDGENAYLDVAVPLLQGLAGWVRLGLHEEPVHVPSRKILTLLLGMILFFVILGVFGAIFFSRKITLPIRSIVEKIGSVDLDGDPVELDVETGDELEVLALSFEEMTDHLQQSHMQLTEANKKGMEAQKLAALGLLASGMAHEINNPLAGIKIGLKSIAKKPQDSSQINQYVPPMLESLDHMEQVIQQTLLFARPDPLRFSSIVLSEMIEHALVMVHYKLEKNKIKVIRRDSGSTERVWADPRSLTQVLVNLVMNAVDAMPNGGKLTINTDLGDNQIHITIADTGFGIKEEQINQIWDPFFTTKEVGKGTGLGLSVTRSLVERLSGLISVTSEFGHGTSFRVSLPVDKR